MKQCPQCALECEDHARFCPSCGTSFPMEGVELTLPEAETAPAPEQNGVSAEVSTLPIPPEPEKKPKRKGPGFLRGVLGVLFCVLAFLLLLASSVIWDVRDFSSESKGRRRR